MVPHPKDDSTYRVSETAKIAQDAYIFGYPLVLMDVTKQVQVSVSAPDEKRFKAPVNQFIHARVTPDPTFTDVVSPNADTLYSIAWLDLSKDPIVLSVPATDKRYYLMQMLDAWTNVFASPGTRTTGNGKGNFAITGPGWSGTLPAGVSQIKAPTNMVWIIGRTQANGKTDYPAVHTIQDQYKLTPLSAWGTTYTAPAGAEPPAGLDTKTSPAEQVAAMDAATFFSRLNALMKANPPAAADASAMQPFTTIGVAPGRPFPQEEKTLPDVEDGSRLAKEQIRAWAKEEFGKNENNWSLNTENVGRYGTDYRFRALVAYAGLGANLPEDAIYPRSIADSEGRPLSGAYRYVIRFPKGQLPPANAFWSVTMYNSRQAFVDNPIDRYAIGDRDDLNFADDGSLTLFIQHDSPGKDKESNWLPAPEDSFNVVMRIYWPKQDVIDGTWKPPAVQRLS